jgi:hypothetical protein
MTWKQYQQSCPYRSPDSPVELESCIVKDSIKIVLWGKEETVAHSTIYGRCCKENCREWLSERGKRVKK